MRLSEVERNETETLFKEQFVRKHSLPYVTACRCLDYLIITIWFRGEKTRFVVSRGDNIHIHIHLPALLFWTLSVFSACYVTISLGHQDSRKSLQPAMKLELEHISCVPIQGLHPSKAEKQMRHSFATRPILTASSSADEQFRLFPEYGVSDVWILCGPTSFKIHCLSIMFGDFTKKWRYQRIH